MTKLLVDKVKSLLKKKLTVELGIVSKQISRLLWNAKDHFHFNKNMTQVHIPSQINPVDTN